MFYKGIVEDNLDDKHLGRVKVRLIGKHTQNKNRTDSENLPTKDLPWAMPIFNTGVSSISGVCDFSVPEINSVVVCGFFDIDEQELFYIGTMGLLGSKKIDGFGNETSPHPKTDYPYSELTRNESDIYQNQLTSNSLFSEPDPSHLTVYPNNRVICTKSGHVIELDDSDGHERIRIRHRSGTFNEYHKDGTNVEKEIKDKYLIAQNINIHSEVNTNLYCCGVINIYGENEINVTSDSDTNITVKGITNINCVNDINITAGGNINMEAGGDIVATASYIRLN